MLEGYLANCNMKFLLGPRDYEAANPSAVCWLLYRVSDKPSPTTETRDNSVVLSRNGGRENVPGVNLESPSRIDSRIQAGRLTLDHGSFAVGRQYRYRGNQVHIYLEPKMVRCMVLIAARNASTNSRIYLMDEEFNHVETKVPGSCRSQHASWSIMVARFWVDDG